MENRKFAPAGSMAQQIDEHLPRGHAAPDAIRRSAAQMSEPGFFVMDRQRGDHAAKRASPNCSRLIVPGHCSKTSLSLLVRKRHRHTIIHHRHQAVRRSKANANHRAHS